MGFRDTDLDPTRHHDRPGSSIPAVDETRSAEQSRQPLTGTDPIRVDAATVPQNRYRKGLKGLALVLLGLAVGATAVWAAETTMGPPDPQLPMEGPLRYTVASETIERSTTAVVVAERSRELVAVNLLEGVVTSVPGTEGEVPTGTVVFEVAGIPVRIVEGAVPFYRELGPGMEGDDVTQLQAALVDLGFMPTEPDGRFGTATASGVREWRIFLGLEPRDRVALGELIAVPDLPRVVVPGEGIQEGRLAPVGSDGLFVFGENPTFVLPLSAGQAAAIDPEATVVVEHDGGEWPAEITSSQDDPERGQVLLMLAGTEGGPVCGEACGSLPMEDRAQLRARIVSVPPTTGPAVPLAAVRTDTVGRASVVLASGATQQVEILAVAGGLAVVAGVEVGDTILIGDAEGTAGP
jgi:peptidoglycan hydrolase-like protein with peptidoglycan-binding domain